jgi:hypothetical protein
MIWRVLGIIGAGSFFVNGFSLLSDPSCVSADFGGGRVIQVTCRGDSLGTFSGTQAGLISLLIGSGLLVLIFFSQIKRLFIRPSIPSEWQNKSLGNSDELVNVKVCDYCEKPVSLDLQKCPQCEGTYFNYKKVSPATRDIAETKVEGIVTDNQTKKCPMCAEEIKIEAIKCRFCQHSFVETGVQKFNTSTSAFFSKTFSRKFLPLTALLIIVGLIGLGYGLNARSKSIERNQLLASGEVCFTSVDNSVNFGCADYPNFKFGLCSSALYLELSDYSTEPYDFNIAGRVAGEINSFKCNGVEGNTNSFDFEGTTERLTGEYEISMFEYNQLEYVKNDIELAGSLTMKISLKN